MRIRTAILGLLAASCLPLSAQTATAPAWIKVGTETTVSYVIVPSGTTYRFGAGTQWCQVTTTAPKTVYVYAQYPCGTDPAPQTPKEIDILQTANPQAIATVASGVTTPQIVAGTPVVAPPVTTAPPATTSSNLTFTYTVTVDSTGKPVSASCTAPVN